MAKPGLKGGDLELPPPQGRNPPIALERVKDYAAKILRVGSSRSRGKHRGGVMRQSKTLAVDRVQFLRKSGYAG